jgi:hypothetical protein
MDRLEKDVELALQDEALQLPGKWRHQRSPVAGGRGL